jgi:hypothetical protein
LNNYGFKTGEQLQDNKCENGDHGFQTGEQLQDNKCENGDHGFQTSKQLQDNKCENGDHELHDNAGHRPLPPRKVCKGVYNVPQLL